MDMNLILHINPWVATIGVITIYVTIKIIVIPMFFKVILKKGKDKNKKPFGKNARNAIKPKGL